VHGQAITHFTISETTTSTGMAFGGAAPCYDTVLLDVVHVTGGINAGGAGCRNFTLTNSDVTGGPVSFGGDNPGPFIVQVTDLTDSSISFSESNGGQILDSHLVRTDISYGAQSSGGVVRGNTLEGSVVHWGESPNGTLDNNVLTNGSRFEIQNVEHMKIRGNQITGSTVDGMQLQWASPPADVEISGNTVRNSLGAGIHLFPGGPSQILVANNHTSDNGEFGIVVPRDGVSSVVDGGGNTSVNNPGGCQGVTCS
jgi:Right handed beta helix region